MTEATEAALHDEEPPLTAERTDVSFQEHFEVPAMTHDRMLDAVAEKMGLSREQCEAFYPPDVLLRGATYGHTEPEAAANFALRFAQSSFAFGGVAIMPITLAGPHGGPGSFTNVPASSLYAADLWHGISAQMVPLRGTGEVLQVLDVGCSTGLSTLSILTVAKDVQSRLPGHPQVRLLGVEPSEEALGLARAAKYDPKDLTRGKYLVEEAASYDRLARELIATQLTERYGQAIATQFVRQSEQMQQGWVDQMLEHVLTPDAGDQVSASQWQDDGTVEFASCERFSLGSLGTEQYHIVACNSVLGSLTDEGLQKMFEELWLQLRPGGFLFTDFFARNSTLAFVNQLAEQFPASAEYVNEAFSYLPNPDKGRYPGALPNLPSLLRKKA